MARRSFCRDLRPLAGSQANQNRDPNKGSRSEGLGRRLAQTRGLFWPLAQGRKSRSEDLGGRRAGPFPLRAPLDRQIGGRLLSWR